jgi:hypothetical protein
VMVVTVMVVKLFLNSASIVYQLSIHTSRLKKYLI